MLHQIGNGALGPVFRAYDQDRDRLVAVKLFRLDLPPERVHQLVGEFEKLIAAELQHPVIAAPRATGIHNNSAYLAQDFAAADSLDIVLRESGALPPAQAARVAGQLAEALDYAADRQIVHGALHPRDILLSQEDIRIVGLGVARALERVGVTAPVRRPYAAPERINDGGWDQSADVFGLAAIVFEMLCGKRVTGTGSEAAEALTEISGADMDALQRVFALALAADPSYRYATATAFSDALKDAMGIDVAPVKPKARRRPKLRVVADDTPLLDEAAPEDQEVSVSPEPEAESLEPAEATSLDVPPRKPRRRRAPAPTPVAIEAAVIPVPELEPDAEPEPDFQLQPEPEPTVEEPFFDEPILEEPVLEELVVEEPVVQEVVTLPAEFAPVEPPPAYASIDEPEPEPVLALEPEPPPAFEPEPEIAPAIEPVIEPEPESEPEPAFAFEPEAPPEPRVSTPPFLTPLAPPPSHSSSIWPIGVAALIGIALGFGGGYTVAIRDRAAVQPTAAATTTATTPAAAPVTAAPAQSAGADVTIAPIASAPPPAPKVAANSPKPTAEQTANPPAFAGRVLVRSTPSGARVIVDGKDRGQTPATIRELGRGEHRLRIVRDGYTAAERRIVLSPSQPAQSLSIPLAREPRARTADAAAGLAAPKPAPKAPAEAGVAALVVDSRPQGAAVLVDGRHVGTTPLSLPDVRAGNHAIRIELDGYRIWTAGVTLSAGEQNRVTASLEK